MLKSGKTSGESVGRGRWGASVSVGIDPQAASNENGSDCFLLFLWRYLTVSVAMVESKSMQKQERKNENNEKRG